MRSIIDLGEINNKTRYLVHTTTYALTTISSEDKTANMVRSLVKMNLPMHNVIQTIMNIAENLKV